MLYQGEDILIQISGDDVVDFENNDFKVYVYPSRGGAKPMELVKDDFEHSDKNTYTYVIGHDMSRGMQGMYTMEVMLKTDEDYRSIFKKENVFTIESCKIKDAR